MKVLITGVAGLLGSKLADYFTERTDLEVIGVDDLSGGYIENVPAKVLFFKLNLAKDKAELESIFKNHNIDYVFHFAAYAAEGLSPFIRDFNYTNNLLATAQVINNCIKYKIKRLVFTSTMAVYGAAVPPFKESYTLNPIDPYGIAKAACEADIKVAGVQHNLDWCIIRPHNVYGDKQNIWDKYRNVLGIWMYQRLNDLPLTIYGDGQQTRAFSYVNDCIPYIAESAYDPRYSKQIFNMGGDDHITIESACDAVIKVTGGGVKTFLPPRHEVKEAWVTHDKIKQAVGFKHSTSLESGLKKMWDWAQKQPMRPRFVWPSYELDVNIYDYWRIK